MSKHTTRLKAAIMFLAAATLLPASTTPAGSSLPSGSTGPYAGDGPAVSFTGVTDNFTNGNWSLGWQFSTNVSIDVTALGYYNASLTGGDSSFQNGTCNCGEVGIYDSAGNLLASTTVTSADPVVGFFNYATIPTLVLAAGQTYYVAAETGTSDYTYFTTGFGVSSDINFIQDEYVAGASLAFPTSSDDYAANQGGAWFGPNFQETAAGTPEPASLFLSGTALMALAVIVYKRKQRA